jgi:hypothetical protein
MLRPLRPRALAALTFALSSSLAAAVPAPGGTLCPPVESKLLAADAASPDQFGTRVALDGDTLLIGAPQNEDAGIFTGAAYVFVRDGAGWTQQAKLLASDLAADSWFGTSVAVSGDTALVGALGDFENEAPGSVYVFVRSGDSWSQVQVIAADDGQEGDAFGSSLALSGDTALIGAPYAGPGLDTLGAVYVYVRSGGAWVRQAKLEATDGADFDRFGSSVALSGDTAAIGAPFDGDQGFSAGSAYVFVRSGSSWSQQAKLIAPDVTFDDRYGSSVAVSGDTVVVGAPNHDGSGQNAGSAYVFVRGGSSWTQQAELAGSDTGEGDRFGTAVALAGDRAAVGAVQHGPAGGVSLLARVGAAWHVTDELLPTGGETGDAFGYSVALSAELAVVGAPADDDAGFQSGAVYVYEPEPASGVAYCLCAAGPCGNADPNAGCASSTGSGALLTARGATDPDGVNLLVAGAPAGQLALFFQGDDALQVSFGDGLRCAGGNVVRITTPPITIGADGSAAYGPCFGDAPISSVTGVVPGSGETRRYQLWYRDPAGPCGATFNLSNGYEIVW